MPSPRLTALAFAGLASFATAAPAPAPAPIVLPPDTSALKPSPLPGYAVAQQKCGICHSADYIEYQAPNLTLAQWTAEAKKMKGLYGAPIDDHEIELVAVYLTKTYGDAKSADVPLPVAAAPSSTADVPKLLTDNGCLACHAVDKAVFGPAYHDVAARYRGDAQAGATVASHIHDGGSGRWGTLTMPAFPALTSDQAAALADYVLKQ